MSELVDFIKQNYLSILTIIVVVLILLVTMAIKGINLNSPKSESKLVQQVVIETLDTLRGSNSTLAASFCESYLGNSQELEGACNQLTENNCAQAKCCVYAKEKCVAGGKDGPTYKTDKDGKLLTIDSYYYLGAKTPT